MPKPLELEGKQFNYWYVIKKVETNKPGSYWLCKCKCGKYGIRKGSDLNFGNTKSCGCFQKEKAKVSNAKHYLRKTKLYQVWHSMKDRCYRYNAKNYKNYGGRGIQVCDEWRNDFKKFYDWSIQHGYKEGLSIDRVNNDGSYSPENCRWTTPIEQANNRRTNYYIEFNGENHTLSQWGRKIGVDTDTIKWRIKKYGLCEKVFLPVNISFSCSARRMRWPSNKQR